MSNKRFMQGTKGSKVQTVVFVVLELKEKEKLHNPPVYPAEKQKESIIRL